MTTETKNPAAMAIQSIAYAHPFSLPSHSEEKPAKDPLEPLYRIIEKQLATEDPRSVCLIFDNLSALSPTVSEEHLIQFVHSCRALIEEHASQYKNASSLIMLAHSDVDSLLVNSLSHSSDLVLKVEGFKMGYSNEEDGQVHNSPLPLSSYISGLSKILFSHWTLTFYALHPQLSFYTADPFRYRDHKLPILIYKLTESTANFRVVRK